MDNIFPSAGLVKETEDEITIAPSTRPPYTPDINEKCIEKSPPQSRNDNPWQRIRYYCQDVFCEFFGTLILILFGNGSIAQVTLSSNTKGDFQSINWGFGIGVCFGVYCSGKSGGHINPAVTLSMCIFRQHPWRKLVPYIIAQLLGAIAGSAILYGNYISAIARYEGGPGILTVPGESNTPSAIIFATYPVYFITRVSQFFSEFIATAILIFCLFALKDDDNLGAGRNTPLALLFVVFGIGAAFGWETAFAINPARDLGPRLFSAMVGYGSGVWSAGGYYFWIPIMAPFLGAVFAAFIYDVFIFTGESPVNSLHFSRHRMKKTDSACRGGV